VTTVWCGDPDNGDTYVFTHYFLTHYLPVFFTLQITETNEQKRASQLKAK